MSITVCECCNTYIDTDWDTHCFIERIVTKEEGILCKTEQILCFRCREDYGYDYEYE